MTPSTSFTSTQAPLAPGRISKETLRALAPLPATAAQLMAMLADPGVSLRRIADLASRDVGIAAGMLRMANSPIFGQRTRIGSIADALRIIGTAQARLLILACGVSQAGQKAMPLYGLPAGAFVRHSELVASLTATLAQQAGYPSAGIAYTAGLLHDIGKVVLNAVAHQRGGDGARGAAFAPALQAPDATLTGAERACFGADHATIGRDLLALWAIPDELGVALLLHHGSAESGAPETPLSACLALANAVAGMADPDYPASNRASLPPHPVLPVELALALAAALLGEGGPA